MALPPGARLGPYEIAALLGSGGMGEVYRARDTRLARTVALKVIHPEVARDPGRQARFQREARVISSLNHPRICTLHDVGTQDGVDYLVMEYGNEGRALGLADARILSVSKQGEMALLRGAAVAGVGPGMLARAPLSGGAPRDLAEGVLDADWTPDGAELAVIRRVAGRRQVEFPLGHKVHEAALAFIRVSPDGRHAAFFGLSSGGA